MIETEQRQNLAGDAIAAKERHSVDQKHLDRAISRAEERNLLLSGEQRAAFEHVTSGKGMAIVIGYAGTGKSAKLGVARQAWELAGYTVRGAALSGIAAENLENGSGIASRTLASLEYQLNQGRDLLGPRDVLVIDEAGMVGTRQLERVLSRAADAGSKVVLVGDPQQLQAIEAGAAFRAHHERHGGVEITEIRRQQADWQRDATRHLATGRTGEAIGAYAENGMVHSEATREVAREQLVARWDNDRQGHPAASRIILAHTKDEVRTLNAMARERLRLAGQLGPDVEIRTERGERQFASGDRLMFLRNERSLGIKNGTLGTIEAIKSGRMAVCTDDGRKVAYDTRDYAHFDHGYAATIHKAQGVTVDRTQVLATPGMDSHGTYVALSRHREQVDLHSGKDDFADQLKLVRIAAQPELALTPGGIADQISRAAESMRRLEHDKLASAQQELRHSTQALLGVVEQARTRNGQQWMLYMVGGAGLLVGMLLWAILPGMVARSVPANWRWPERMATRALGQHSVVEAGIQLIRSEDPAQWDAIAEAARFERDNREQIGRCKQMARKTKALASCVVRISQ